MSKVLGILCLLTSIFVGFQMGMNFPKKQMAAIAEEEKQYPLKERKTFVFLLYAYNQADWVERSLRSIFEQEYDYFRIVFIDDGSKDNTFAVAKRFIEGNNQSSRTLLIRNDERLGVAECFYQAIGNLLDQEIVVPIFAKDWLSHSGALTRLNLIFQNPDIWAASSEVISFPSYEIAANGMQCFYAAIFKQIPIQSLRKTEKTKMDSHFYLSPLNEVAQRKTKQVKDILYFNNTTVR